MKDLIGRVKARIAQLRAAQPWLDRVLRTQEHYGATGASQQAGAVTYFGFLSVFPLLAVAFFVVGWIAKVYPDAHADLLTAIDSVLPGLVGDGGGKVSLTDIQNAANTVGILGVLGLAYAGLGWISALRTALVDVFEVPKADQPNWLFSRLRDLLTLVALGVVMGVSVAMAGLIAVGPIGPVISIAAGLVADVLLFWTIFVLLARPLIAHRHLLAGAVVGGVGFELLKQLSSYLLTKTQGQPAFQVFGISLILLVWINYFTRLTLYAAAYAFTGAPAVVDDAAPVQGPSTPPLTPLTSGAPGPAPAVAFVAGVVAAIGGMAAWRGLRRR